MTIPPLTGKALEELNPGVRRLIPYLREHGFNTVNSGDGKTHLCECDHDFAFVEFEVPSKRMVKEADRLFFFLKDDLHLPMVDDVTIEQDDDLTKPEVQVNYDPASGRAFMILVNVTDEMLPEKLPKPKPDVLAWFWRLFG